jgi:hypothetical protein
MNRAMLHLVKITLVALLLMAIVAPAVQAQTAPLQIDCNRLSGTGSFSSPLWIGRIDRTTIVVNCPRLSSGNGFNSRYYAFDLARPAAYGTYVGTMFIITPDAQSSVHPRLASPSGITLMTSMSNGFWYSSPPWTFRLFHIVGLPAGRYLLGVEKLDSPLGSLQTPPFNLAFLLP